MSIDKQIKIKMIYFPNFGPRGHTKFTIIREKVLNERLHTQNSQYLYMNVVEAYTCT